ncbi:hypothetical protein GLW07_20670 [Bacillus hwajinpoensis]|uniref:Uncharacterized protein n=1 Tax=Guptibacillus hwajinpoensis TaxID=208199 RepID=A0A845F4Q0_9BACL|nr:MULTISPECIES: hypothetical protein [Bacillaceae]MCA0993040.1 hypothetical protein [Pseudalkalibacillus hwajinpoensis]MYL65780.1 hypothetical protein [Pseudalkalibacillus hwajinpoensis]
MAGFIFFLIAAGSLLLTAMVSRLLLIRKYSFHNEQMIRKQKSAYLFGTCALVFLVLGISMAMLVF